MMGVFSPFTFKVIIRKLLGHPVVRSPCFHYEGYSSTVSWGTKILQAMGHGQKLKLRKQSDYS